MYGFPVEKSLQILYGAAYKDVFVHLNLWILSSFSCNQQPELILALRTGCAAASFRNVPEAELCCAPRRIHGEFICD